MCDCSWAAAAAEAAHSSARRLPWGGLPPAFLALGKIHLEFRQPWAQRMLPAEVSLGPSARGQEVYISFKNAFFFKRNVHLLAPAGSTVRPTETVETFEARVVRSLSRALEHKLEYSYDHFSYFVQGNDDGALEFPFPFALPG